MVFAYRLLNIRQWLKNELIFIPAFFAGVTWSKVLIVELILAFCAFSLVTSAVYLANDLRDRQTDAQHPTKQQRLIAAGKVSVQQALFAIGALLLLAAFLLLQLPPEIFNYVGGYLLMNIAYSFYLKQLAFVDLVVLISGYWIRLFIGGIIAHVPLSFWLLALVGLLALYLILIKRKSDVLLYEENGNLQRQSVLIYQKMHFSRVFSILIFCIIGLYTWYILTVFGWLHPHLLAVGLTVPLFTWLLLWFHKKTQRFPHSDPIHLLITDPFIVSVVLISLSLFTLTLYS